MLAQLGLAWMPEEAALAAACAQLGVAGPDAALPTPERVALCRRACPPLRLGEARSTAEIEGAQREQGKSRHRRHRRGAESSCRGRESKSNLRVVITSTG